MVETVILKQLVGNDVIGDNAADIDSPYSLIEWKRRSGAVAENSVDQYYNNYVLNWFAVHQKKPVSAKFLLRQKYLYLLEQLQLFFSKEEKNSWYNKINLADEKELLLAIPYFAKKLKSISLYYLKLRNRLHSTKIKYNSIGTSEFVKQEIYNYLLESFSSANTELPPMLQNAVPQLSTLQNSLVVDIEELYDDHSYFDHSTTVPASGYFNLFHAATEKHLQTKGIVLSSSDWLFNCLTVSPTANLEGFVTELTGNIFEKPDALLYQDFIENFLSENKFLVTTFSASATNQTTDISIARGNNYFYYPFSTLDNSLTFKGSLPLVNLSAIKIQGATAGFSLEDSDTIFVRNGESIEGAWLYNRQFDTSEKNVESYLKRDSTTSFIFPYPGYGLSAIGTEWTGSSFTYEPKYDFLQKSLKANVNRAYWSQQLEPNAITEISLNSTTLVSAGAYPNKNPNFADQICIDEVGSAEDNLALRVPLSGAWLYQFDKTSLPIVPNVQLKTVIWWPYMSFSQTEEDIISTIESLQTTNSFVDVCQPVPINNLDTSLMIAASSMDGADTIYKFSSLGDINILQNATECAWLSSSYVELSGYRVQNQDGFALLLEPGKFTRFVWSGPILRLDDVFTTIPHQRDCPFSSQSEPVSAFEWKKCSCKQVYHTPFGHPKNKLEDLNNFADCIFEDTTNNLDEIDYGSWVDSFNEKYTNSSQIAWYKTTTEHSWGNGSWVSNNSLSSTPFLLKPGKSYIYYRANTKFKNSEPFPAYSVNYKFGTKNTAWIQAKFSNKNQKWISTDKPSTMSLYANDILSYDRSTSTVFNLITSIPTVNVSENVNSVWSAYDKVVVGESFLIYWPATLDSFGSTNKNQIPSVNVASISSINAWKLTHLDTNVSETITSNIGNLYTVNVVLTAVGTYSIAVTATDTSGNKINLDSSTIPLLTAIEKDSFSQDYISFDVPTNGFLMEQDLFGWNYNTNKPQATAPGAKPYWATLYINKDQNNKQKGIYSWGYPSTYTNNYLPNHNPTISNLRLVHGSVVSYTRKNYTFEWKQPITFKTFVDDAVWCSLSSDTTSYFSNLSSIYSTQRILGSNLVVDYNKTPTNITLSNVKNGAPVEIFYNALSNFIWPITFEVESAKADSISNIQFDSTTPWKNLPNRFFPTIATIPVLENTYSEKDVGGYFLPNNVGVSQFINKDFVTSTNATGQFLTEQEQIHVGGRGRTQQDQPTIYTWEEKNQWLKEPAVAGQLAGAVKKSLTKKLQTFIPYQTDSNDNVVGLVTPTSRTSPWGGPLGDQWTDVKNNPRSFTGVPNVSAWTKTQILKQAEKTADCWTSDIYGNQYALFKDLRNVKLADQYNTTGELWTRTNDQMVSPASISLSSVFNIFSSPNDVSFYSQLTGSGIKHIDCFYNTLLIETPLSAVYIQLDYDYENSKIHSSFDNVIRETLHDKKRLEKTWLLSKEKKVITLFTVLTSTKFYPRLTEFDLNSNSYKEIFPNAKTTKEDIVNSFAGIEIRSLSDSSFYYNEEQRTYLITYKGLNGDNKTFLTDFSIQQLEVPVLTEINHYIDNVNPAAILEPPIISHEYLDVIGTGLNFVVTVSGINNPTTYSINTTNVPTVQVTNNGTFTGSVTSSGLYHINYTVSNEIGSNVFCLSLTAS